MSNFEEEIRVLREKNNDLVQKVQYWKMAAAQREDEKLVLMKEINEVRLQLGIIKNGSRRLSVKLEAALQAGNERALGHLVRASSEIATIMEVTKSYIREMNELDTVSPRWSTIGGTPSSERSERVHRVPPTLVGGRSIQPVVSLSRTLFNLTSTTSASANQRNIERAVPMHMLQDVYIPLTRIDAGTQGNNVEVDVERNSDLNDSNGDLEMEDDAQQLSEVEEFEASPRLDVVVEDVEENDEIIAPPSSIDDGLEGPSWLLDVPHEARASTSNSRVKEEPDSTTEVNDVDGDMSPSARAQTNMGTESGISVRVSCEFSPTVHRRKRIASPVEPNTTHPSSFSPRLNSTRRNSVKERVLKVMVTKMQLGGDDDIKIEMSPPKRPKPERLMSFDAPSPSGTTDARVIVLDANDVQQDVVSPISYVTLRGHNSRRERHGDRIERGEQVEQNVNCEQNERKDRTERDEHSYQNERGNGSDHSEINGQQDRTAHNCRDDEMEFIAVRRKEHHKRREHSRNNQKVYDAQSDQHNYSDPNEHASGSVSRDRRNRPVRNDQQDRLDRDQLKRRTDHRERNDVRERSNQRDRCDHADCERSERPERNDQSKRSDQNDLISRSDCPEQSVQHDRGDRSEGRVRNNRHERNNKVNRSDRNECTIENVSREGSDCPERSDQRKQFDRDQHKSRTDRRERDDCRERSERPKRSDRNDHKSSSELPEQSDQRDRCDPNDNRDRNDRTKRSDRHYGSIENNISRRDRSERARSSSKDTRDSDSESVSESITEGRSRRARNVVIYKEKPLNRKMRR